MNRSILAIIFVLVLFSGSAPFSFSTEPSMPPGHTELMFSDFPQLNKEIHLTINLVHDRYGGGKMIDKGDSIQFGIYLPKHIKILDEDFISGGNYYYGSNDGYQYFSATRTIDENLQTILTVKPTQPGVWQIIAHGNMFTEGKIFLAITENYSYVYDSPLLLAEKQCSYDNTNLSQRKFVMLDGTLQQKPKGIQNDFIDPNHTSYTDWKLLVSPVDDLVYAYDQRLGTTIVIDGNVSESTFDLDLKQGDRIRSIVANTETDLVYILNDGHLNYSRDDHSWIMVYNNTNGSYLEPIEYTFDLDMKEDYPISLLEINSSTNTLYGLSSDALHVIDLEENQIVKSILMRQDNNFIPYAMKINSLTDTIYVLDGYALHVIDGSTHDIIDKIQIGEGSYQMRINEKANEIYVLNLGTTLFVIDGNTNEITKTVTFSHIVKSMDFNPMYDLAYFSHDDGSIVSINVNTYDFDIVDVCSPVSSIDTNAQTGKIYAIDDPESNYINRIMDSAHWQNSQHLSLEFLSYERNNFHRDYDDNIEFLLRNNSLEQSVDFDSIMIKNLDTGQIIFSFSEVEISQGSENDNDDLLLSWNRTDLEGNKLSTGTFALMATGENKKGTIHEVHKIFRIIDDAQLDQLKSMGYGKLVSLIHQQDSSSKQTKSDLGTDHNEHDDLVCTNDNHVLVLRDNGKHACVKEITAAKKNWIKIIKEDYETIPKKETVDIEEQDVIELELPVVTSERVSDTEAPPLPLLELDFSMMPAMEIRKSEGIKITDWNYNYDSNKAIIEFENVVEPTAMLELGILESSFTANDTFTVLTDDDQKIDHNEIHANTGYRQLEINLIEGNHKITIIGDRLVRPSLPVQSADPIYFYDSGGSYDKSGKYIDKTFAGYDANGNSFVSIVITNEDNNLVDKFGTYSSPNGEFHARWTIPDGINTGYYDATVSDGSKTNTITLFLNSEIDSISLDKFFVMSFDGVSILDWNFDQESTQLEIKVDAYNVRTDFGVIAVSEYFEDDQEFTILVKDKKIFHAESRSDNLIEIFFELPQGISTVTVIPVYDDE